MKHAILLMLLQLASSGADAFYTERAFHQWRPVEQNPIARPFVQTRGGRVAYFSVTAGLKIAVPIELRRHHHEKLATAFAVAGIADSAGAAGFTAYCNTRGFPAPKKP
jgi:hypothetical protein